MPAPHSFTAQSKLLAFDVESNGLHGEGFAVGAVLVDAKGKVIDEFSARCPIKGKVDDWVEQNVLPQLEGFPETHKTAKAMRDDFWRWFHNAKEQADFVLADNGYPVEARFLIQCQEDDIENRYWGHAFPLLDLSSMFLAKGIKPLTSRDQFIEDEHADQPQRHNPRWDAWASAMAAVMILVQR